MNKQKRILVRDGVELSALYFPLLAITPLIEETGLFNNINVAAFSGISHGNQSSSDFTGK